MTYVPREFCSAARCTPRAVNVNGPAPTSLPGVPDHVVDACNNPVGPVGAWVPGVPCCRWIHPPAAGDRGHRDRVSPHHGPSAGRVETHFLTILSRRSRPRRAVRRRGLPVSRTRRPARCCVPSEVRATLPLSTPPISALRSRSLAHPLGPRVVPPR